MYRVLCADWEVTSPCLLTSDSSCLDPIWQRGVRFPAHRYNLSQLVFQSEGPHATPFPDYSRDSHGCPIVSAALREALEASGISNVDYYPASVIPYRSDSHLPGFYAANILGRVSCLNRARSTFRNVNGVIVRMTKMFIDDDAASGLLLFRLAELPTVILVSSRLEPALLRLPLQGFRLIPPEVWDTFDGFASEPTSSTRI